VILSSLHQKASGSGSSLVQFVCLLASGTRVTVETGAAVTTARSVDAVLGADLTANNYTTAAGKEPGDNCFHNAAVLSFNS